MKFRILTALSVALLTAWGSSAHANLVTNGGFETGDFSGWTTSGNGLSIDAVFPNSGSFDAAFSAGSTDPSPGTLSQSIATTAGASYLLSFAIQDEAGLFSNAFTVSLGTFSLVITGDQAAASYTTETATVDGVNIVSSSTLLSFMGTNDIAAWNLDDVSLTPVAAAIPEPSSILLLGAALALLLVNIMPKRKRHRA